ncbi:MAG: S-layer homology domain-containing protein [Oscillospiraceae bacterium]|nr:S-layer homology domain-containing protein [Oscillospiraceae bacterium]
MSRRREKMHSIAFLFAFAVACVLIIAGLTLSVHATDLIVSSEADIQSAISSATSNDIIIIQNDITLSGTLSIPSGADVTITSLSGAETLIIPGGMLSRHFIVPASATLTLQEIALDGSNSGGGIKVSGGTLNLDDVTIENCYGSYGNAYGGAIYAESASSVTINGGSITGNRAASAGGGIYAISSDVTIDGTSFESNSVTATYTPYESSPFDGGAIYIKSGNLQITNGIFHDNAALSGGAIFAAITDIEIIDSAFDGNHGTLYSVYGGTAGAICASACNMTISGSDFTGNEADYGNGAISASGTNEINGYAYGDIEISDCTFTENTAVGGTGAIDTQNNTTTITGCTFTRNEASTGGAISAFNVDLTIKDHCVFTGNKALSTSGGAVKVYNTDITLIDSEFTENTAATYGGAIYAYYYPQSTPTADGVLTISNCKFTENVADLYGGAIHAERVEVEIGATTFTDNTATTAGGGIYIYGNPYSTDPQTVTDNHAIVTDSTFEHNIAGESGGGIYAGSALDVIDSSFTDNEAGQSGGGIYTDTDITIRGSSFNENKAAANMTYTSSTSSYGGGALYSMVSSQLGSVTINDSTFKENQALTGGGIYAADLTISGSALEDNQAAYGGGIRIHGAGDLTIEDCSLKNNVATSSGGGLYTPVSTQTSLIVTIKTSSFEGNTASSGGGISVSGTTIVSDSTFTGNVANGTGTAGCGGGISVGYGSLSVNSSTFTSNTATNTGGGIDETCGTITVAGSQLIRNTAKNGGGVASASLASGGVTGGPVVIDGASCFENNTASALGGGVWTSAVPVKITGDSVFIGNSAVSSGGGVYSQSGDITVENSSFEGNYVTAASSAGGGIYAHTGAIAVVDSSFTENIAVDSGGGIFTYYSNQYSKAADISGSTFTKNSADYGGGIFTAASDLTIRDGCTFDGNSATYGGGICTDSDYHTVTISGTNNILKANTAEYGAGLYTYETPVNVTGGAAFDHNSANSDGGAVYVCIDASFTVSGAGTFTGNCATAGDGGAIYTEDTTYQNVKTAANTVFTGNTAQALYEPPADTSTYPDIQFTSVSPTGLVHAHPLNNFDINYTDGAQYYIVTYQANEGTGGPYADHAASNYTVLSASAAGISRSGYTFTGWNTAADGSGTGYAAGAVIQTIDQNLTLYAQWKKDSGSTGSTTYSVTYNANGGTGSYRDSGISSGTSYSVLSGTDTGISYSGYTLRGWNTSADGTGTSYAVGDTVTIRSSITLYAVWTEGEDDGYLRVTYYPNGATSGDVPVDSTLYHSGDTVTVLYNTGLLRRSGYYFSGWALTESGGTVLRPGTQFTMGDANVQLYARWSASTSGGSSLETLYDTEVPLATLTTDHIWYIQGYPDNSVKPDGNLTRAEAAAIFYRLIDDANGKAQTDYAISFGDVTQSNWYYHEVAYLTNRGILFGYEDGTFRGDAPISRAEFAAIASRFDALWLGTDNAFSDVSESHWAVQYINSAAEKGWITGYADGTFRPDQSISRAESVTLINRVLDRSLAEGNEPDGLHSYIDLDNTYWAYYDIMEASHTHEYDLNDAQEEIWTTYSYA